MFHPTTLSGHRTTFSQKAHSYNGGEAGQPGSRIRKFLFGQRETQFLRPSGLPRRTQQVAAAETADAAFEIL